ncbi:SDR family NAD(P)-dependent oxidoreductase [Wenyingzhuangia sp. IMCC45533]
MKTALITGATSGIGKELAYIHAKRKGNLVLVARRYNLLHKIKLDIEKKYKVTVFIIQKDLTDATAAKEVYNELNVIGVKVDYLINNAGFGGIGKFYERQLEDELNMIQLNITALTSLTHIYLKEFIEKEEGKILNVSSTASLISGPMQAVYFATKAYVTSFSNALWQELKDTNITVTNLMPGATETDFGKISGMDKTSLFDDTASPKTVALAGYNAMMKGKLNVMAGLTFSQKILLKLSSIIPTKTALKMVYDMQQVKKED